MFTGMDGGTGAIPQGALKVTRRKLQIFADSPLLLEISAFGGHKKPQKTADFRRKPQETAGKPPSNKKEIPKTPSIPRSKRYLPKSKSYFPKNKRYLPKVNVKYFREFLKNLKYLKFTVVRRFPLEPFFEINPGILCSGNGS